MKMKGRHAMKCSDVMTRDPECSLPDDLVTEVAQRMLDEDIGSIPIIEDDQTRKLIGIVTDRDLALKVVAEGRDPRSTRVSDVMTRQVVTCFEDDDVQKALDAMSEHQLRRIPVVDREEHIVGIIAQADIATRVDQPQKTAEVVKDISQ